MWHIDKMFEAFTKEIFVYKYLFTSMFKECNSVDNLLKQFVMRTPNILNQNFKPSVSSITCVQPPFIFFNTFYPFFKPQIYVIMRIFTTF